MSAVRKPRGAASRATPAPVLPPPMTSTSTGSAAMASSAAARVRYENGDSANSPPDRPSGRFRSGPHPLVPPLRNAERRPGGEVLEGESNVAWKRTACSGGGGVPDTGLQVGHGAERRARRGPGALCRPGAARARELGRRRGGRADLRKGGAVGPGAERGPRGEPPPPVPQGNPRLLLEPRLRLRRPGDHFRPGPDRPRPRQRHSRRWGGVALGHSDPRVATPGRHPDRGEQGENVEPAARGPFPHPPPRPDSRLAGPRPTLPPAA